MALDKWYQTLRTMNLNKFEILLKNKDNFLIDVGNLKIECIINSLSSVLFNIIVA